MKIDINDLPKYSIWVHRLLGIIEWPDKKKTSTEIIREFDKEKWGSLLEKVRSAKTPLNLENIEKIVLKNNNIVPCIIGNELQTLSSKEAFDKQYNIVKDIIAQFLPSKGLCELGAGYGQFILNLAEEDVFSGVPIIAGEYTFSGVELLKYLSASLKRDIEIGRCDFSKPEIIDGLNIPKNSIIFTCYAAHYVQEYSSEIISGLSLLNPKVVIHFEPLMEHCDDLTLIGALQKQYIKRNGYNQNLLTILKKEEQKGLIEILIEQPQVFGSNPFLPFSVVAWRPQ